MSALVAVHHTTTTTSNIWCRHTIDGQMTVVCNGQTFIGGLVDSTVKDGTALCLVTGLSPNSVYLAQVIVNGVVIGEVSIRTNPVPGDTFSIGYSSCCSHLHDPIAYQALVNNVPDLKAFVFGGDNIYCTMGAGTGGTYTENGETIYDIEDSAHDGNDPTSLVPTMRQLYNHYRLWWKKASYRYIMSRIPCYFIADDHEWPGNNWINTSATITLAQSIGGVANGRTGSGANAYYAWASTQQHLDNMKQWCIDAFHHYTSGNPTSPSDANVADSLYYDFKMGDAHIICVEDTMYSDDLNADGAGLPTCNRYGSVQLAWIQDILLNSDRTWKIIMVGKGEVDDFNLHNTLHGAIQTYLQAHTGPTGINGVLIVSGDTHTSGMFWHTCPNISVGPSGTGANDIPDGYPTYNATTGNGHRWKLYGNASHQFWKKPESLAAYIRPHGATKLEYGIINPSGEIVYSGEMLPNTNTISYPTQKFG